MSEKIIPQPGKPQAAMMPHALQSGYAIMEYIVERTLGGGGFGITYLAHDKNLKLPVAIKEYFPADLAKRTTGYSVQAISDSKVNEFKLGLDRFLAEARAIANFRHPNIVRVLRFFASNGTAYIVMDCQPE